MPKVQKLIITCLSKTSRVKLRQDLCAINDPLGQTHGPAICDHYSRFKVVLFCEILKSGDGRTDVQTTRAKIVITT